MQIFEKVYRVR